MKTLEAEICHEKEQIAEAIAEIETSLRVDLAREIGIGEEIFTAEELLDCGLWKEDFCQWEELHAEKYECDDDDELALCWREKAFESWLNKMKSVYLG